MKAPVSQVATLETSQSDMANKIAFLLMGELAFARELGIHLRHASRAFKLRFRPRIAELVIHLHNDLLADSRALTKHLEILSPGCGGLGAGVTGQQSFWALFPTSDADSRSHLEALVGGYARFMRITSDIATGLRALGDAEGLRILERFTTAGGRALWYLEIYLEAVALHNDESRLPLWGERSQSL
jgi:hypothetical protein